MNLSFKTKEKLKQIIKEYENEKINEDFFVKIIEILNKDELFLDVLNLEFNNKKIVMTTDSKKEKLGKIYINFKNFLRDLPKHTNNFVDEVKLDELQIYFGMFYILHECVHILQYLWAYENYNKHKEINDIYHSLVTKMNTSRYVQIMYKLNRFKFFMERNANLIAFELLHEIYCENAKIYLINCEYYLSNMFDMYNVSKHKTPIEVTYKLIGENEVIDTSGLSFEELIRHGFWMNEEQWKKFESIYNVYTKPYTAVTIEEEILRRIKEL